MISLCKKSKISLLVFAFLKIIKLSKPTQNLKQVIIMNIIQRYTKDIGEKAL